MDKRFTLLSLEYALGLLRATNPLKKGGLRDPEAMKQEIDRLAAEIRRLRAELKEEEEKKHAENLESASGPETHSC